MAIVLASRQILSQHLAAAKIENSILRRAFHLEPHEWVVDGDDSSVLVDGHGGQRTRRSPTSQEAIEFRKEVERLQELIASLHAKEPTT